MKVTSMTLEDGTTITGRSAQRVLDLIGSQPAAKRAVRRMREAKRRVRMTIAEREDFGTASMGLTFQRPGRPSNTKYTLIGWSTERLNKDGILSCIALLERHDGQPVRIGISKLMNEMRCVRGIARISDDRIRELRAMHGPYADGLRRHHGWETVRECA